MGRSTGLPGWALLAGALAALPPAAVAAADRHLAVGVNATGNCKFNAASTQLSFGALDPALRQDVGGTAALTFKCTKGSAWSVSGNGGLHEAPAGTTRMRHATLDAYIPYRIELTNAAGTSPGANVQQTLGIRGLVRAGDYVDAPQGVYADTVTLTISP